jgi:hypothetical protein
MTGPTDPSPPTPTSLVARLFRRAVTSRTHGDPAAWIGCHDRAAAPRIAERLRRLGGRPTLWEDRRYEFGSLAARDKALREVRAAYGWTSVEAAAARRTAPRSG